MPERIMRQIGQRKLDIPENTLDATVSSAEAYGRNLSHCSNNISTVGERSIPRHLDREFASRPVVGRCRGFWRAHPHSCSRLAASVGEPPRMVQRELSSSGRQPAGQGGKGLRGGREVCHGLRAVAGLCRCRQSDPGVPDLVTSPRISASS